MIECMGVEVAQTLGFVEVDLVGTLTTKNGIDRCILDSSEKHQGRLMRNILDFVNLMPLGTRIMSRVSHHPEPPVCLRSFSIASKLTPLRSEGSKSPRVMTSRKELRLL